MVVMDSIGESPLHDVSILVFEVLTKQPSKAPSDFSVSQRKFKSGR